MSNARGTCRSPRRSGHHRHGASASPTARVAPVEQFAAASEQPASLALSSTEGRRDLVVVVRVDGELDLLTAPLLDAHLTTTIDAISRREHSDPVLASRRPPLVICDLDSVTFLGAAAMSVLVHAAASAHASRVTFVVRANRQASRRPLLLARLDRDLILLGRASSSPEQQSPRR